MNLNLQMNYAKEVLLFMVGIKKCYKKKSILYYILLGPLHSKHFYQSLSELKLFTFITQLGLKVHFKIKVIVYLIDHIFQNEVYISYYDTKFS